jgi:hypothetical protein
MATYRGDFPKNRGRRIPQIDLDGVRKENIKLREEIQKAKEAVANIANYSVNYTQAFSQSVRTASDNDALRIQGHQPFPEVGVQRKMMGDGTNPFMRY